MKDIPSGLRCTRWQWRNLLITSYGHDVDAILWGK